MHNSLAIQASNTSTTLGAVLTESACVRDSLSIPSHYSV